MEPKKNTWKHIDSVLEELGEIANDAKTERAKRNQLILKIKAESDVITKTLERREVTLFQVLQVFAEEHCLPGMLSVREFKHGRVRIDDGIVEVTLKKGTSKGKPK